MLSRRIEKGGGAVTAAGGKLEISELGGCGAGGPPTPFSDLARPSQRVTTGTFRKDYLHRWFCGVSTHFIHSSHSLLKDKMNTSLDINDLFIIVSNEIVEGYMKYESIFLNKEPGWPMRYPRD